MSVHRTRHRSRAVTAVTRCTKGDRADRARERLAGDVAELRVLWARLPAALVRDTAGGSSTSPGKSTPAAYTPAVTNENVQDAGGIIAREADELGAQIMRILTLDRRGLWPVPVVLELADSWHRRLTITDNGDATASEICTQVGRWRNLARAALGLSLPGRDTTERCPYHRDTPAVLRIEGDQATLAEPILEGRWPAAGEPRLRWQYGAAVACPQCRRRWNGITALAALRLLLDAADAADAAEVIPTVGPESWKFGVQGQSNLEENPGPPGRLTSERRGNGGRP